MEDKTCKKSVGNRIRELRKKHNETQKDLAERIATTQNNVSKIENGETGLTFDNLIQISNHYNVSLDYLCKGEGGADLLDTLNNYVKLEYRKIFGLFNDDTSLSIPYLSINDCFYHYLSQVAHANNDSAMPEDVKSFWIKKVESEFNDTIVSDDYSHYHSFIPFKESILEEQNNIIPILIKHLMK